MTATPMPPEASLATPTSYDVVPYPGIVNARTHPDHLALMATLMGMTPTPIERCRVLELGCASGENLLPMAWSLPHSEFVGVDLSSRQIAAGRQWANELGVKNIGLHHLSILDVDDSLGQFDYIIAKGVYSWIPPDAQEKLLDICQRQLASNGVAYVDYNVYPGWHMRGIVRDMMLFGAQGIAEPQAQVRRAIDVLNLMVAVYHSSEESVFGSLLATEWDLIQKSSEAYVLHEHLEEHNTPLYFHEFIARAAQHGLQYLAETDVSLMLSDNLPPRVAQWVENLTKDRIEFEQYLDFLRNRVFRQTLLCHQGVPLAKGLHPQAVRRCHVASRATPTAANGDAHAAGAISFKGVDDAKFTTNHPLTKAALMYLQAQWPRAAPFQRLVEAASAQLQQGHTEQDEEILAANILRAYSYSHHLVELHVHAPQVVGAISERPIANPCARFEAQRVVNVTNVWHHPEPLNNFDHFVLQLLDGQHDRTAIVAALMAGPISAGVLTLEDEELLVTNPQHLRERLFEEVEHSLRYLAQAALLVG
jgi:methyltransferase-like protein